jgi:hypothetical protein
MKELTWSCKVVPRNLSDLTQEADYQNVSAWEVPLMQVVWYRTWREG